MINFDFLQFDQTNLWFFIVSALGLLRERRLLPFVLVGIANLIHGPLAATLIAGFILWHQVDSACPKWVQLKAALGFFFIFMAAVSPEPFQEFSVVMGAIFLSLSFSQGGLGVIPPLVLLRAYVPHPANLEIILGFGAFFCIAAEGLAFAKFSHSRLILGILETLCTFGIFLGFQELVMRISEERALLGIGAGIVILTLALAAIVHWKNDSFWRSYRLAKPKISHALTFGNRMLGNKIPWIQSEVAEPALEMEQSFNRLFFLAVATCILFAVFCIVSRGGLN